jgi:hypothetical protein
MKIVLFSLGTLLFITVLAITYVAGHSHGYNSGYRAAKEDYGIVADLGAYDVASFVIPLPGGN